MRFQDNLFLGAGIVIYILKWADELMNPSIIDIMFFMEFAFMPLVVFYFFHIIDVQMFYPKKDKERGKEE